MAAIEIISLNRPDLSEQNYWYFTKARYRLPEVDGAAIGLEREWPYNSDFCREWTSHPDCSYLVGSYYSRLLGLHIPCTPSAEDHQGVTLRLNALGNSVLAPYFLIEDTTKGRCVISEGWLLDTDFSSDTQRRKFLAETLNKLKRPITMTLPSVIREENGFVTNMEPGISTSADYHRVVLIGFIEAKDVPVIIKNDLRYAGKDYFIAKSSEGKEKGDRGFYYLPANLMLEKMSSGIRVYYYDRHSERYRDCPFRAFSGVAPADKITSSIPRR
ncbi:TPA: hypothetical protein HA318_03555 [Candidatus Micrarchaeota archaeon]|nr:MAG: hypothetical protein AUJ65_03620 [Candidatus Micrarchaeota archaeon CG1_02_51_15]HII39051.1 hypothetical protein [Candidatus Micrarchaeota archaeon]